MKSKFRIFESTTIRSIKLSLWECLLQNEKQHRSPDKLWQIPCQDLFAEFMQSIIYDCMWPRCLLYDKDELVQERRNSIANAPGYVLFALTYRYDIWFKLQSHINRQVMNALVCLYASYTFSEIASCPHVLKLQKVHISNSDKCI